MPAYPWLGRRDAIQAGDITAKMTALRTLGHPYTDEEIAGAAAALEGKLEIDVVIEYLQMLGTGFSEGAH